jgi:hypothetical protein
MGKSFIPYSPKPPAQSDWSVEAPVFVPQARSRSRLGINNSRNVSKKKRVSPRPDGYIYEDEHASVTSKWNVTTAKVVDEKKSKAGEHSSDQRTLLIKGLPENSALLNAVKVVRRGQPLNVYIRYHKRLDLISLVDASAAAASLVYSKGTAISVLSKRVSAHYPWSCQKVSMLNTICIQVKLLYDVCQFHGSIHVLHRISRRGATRSPVIRYVKHDMTSQSISDELEHIDNLKVVNINITAGEAFISLNSVHNAIIDRQCPHSRFTYKYCSIDHYPDECDQPLPAVPTKAAGKSNGGPKVKAGGNRGSNRFQPLADDGSDEEDADDVIVDDQTQQQQQQHRIDRGLPALRVADWGRRA